MIGKVDRGWDAPGLVSYLMGPGKHNEHTRPTVIASWQNDPGALQPTMIGGGDFDFDPAELAALRAHVHAPAEAVGLPRRQPAEGEPGYTKHGYVWHTSIAIPAGDGAIAQETWAQIARDVMERTGIAATDDPGGCRWIAVHHGRSAEGNDHIHIAATLVRQDTGARVHPRNDYRNLRSVMREWEDRLGLTVTAQNARDADRPSTRGEFEKAARRAADPDAFVPSRTDPTETIRGQLRQVVAETASTANDTEEFLAGLRTRGLLVHLHHDRTGAVDGYAVALPGDRNRQGRPVFYGGAKLARDLSWPRVSAEFSRHGGVVADRPAERGWDLGATRLDGAREVVTRAQNAFARQPYAAQRDIAVAAHRMVATYTKVTAANPGPNGKSDPTGPRIQSVWAGHRSARAARLSSHPRHDTGRPLAGIATDLNAASRSLLALRALGEGGPAKTASVELAVALAGLIAEIAAWHDRTGASAGGTAARGCVTALRTHADRVGTPAVAAATPAARDPHRGPPQTAGRPHGTPRSSPGARRTPPPPPGPQTGPRR
ncbi:relaxase/mobilization nuclease domain-containing protein [Williamsia herbipolensis]|uniref:relaxase/mobilization nuclease domain-containing protein n=1 Tax=Williamsia herbipolensis TaxID=1603258 RepID=UPI0005F85479|nr:relaxase/mobilization nuclease domain-containing protein [Williamsia herbipolensis]